MNMYCSNCGTQVSNETEKCHNCGAVIVGQAPQPQSITNNTPRKKNIKKLIWSISGGVVALLVIILLLPSITYLFTSGEDYYQKAIASTDDRELIVYMGKAAKKGHPEAMYLWGVSLFQEGFPREKLLEAIEWFRKSAEAGYPPAQMMYGINLINGSIAQKNVSEGYRWLETSAKNGCGEAQKTLGIAYFQGDVGISRDIEKAKYWLSKAAEQYVDGAEDMLSYINHLTSPSRYNIMAETLDGNVRNLGYKALRNQLGY